MIAFPCQVPSFDSLESLVSSGFPADKVDQVHLDEDDKNHLGMASEAKRGTVLLKAGEKQPVFIKMCRKGSTPEKYNGKLHTFDKEIYFFKIIAPILVNESKKELQERFPSFVACGTVNGELYLVLEDFSVKGFHSIGKHDFMTDAQVKRCLEVLASMHAASKVAEVKGQVNWSESDLGKATTDYLTLPEHEELYSPFFCGSIEAYLKVMQAVMTEKDKGNPLVDGIKVPASVNPDLVTMLISLAPKMLRVLRKTRDPQDGGTDVLCHGDYHMWNVAYVDEDLDQVVLIDFQEYCYASFACDIQQFICQTTTADQRKRSLDDLLSAYADQFTRSWKEYADSKHSLPTGFSLESIRAEYAKKSPIGYLLGFDYVMMRFIDDYEMFGKIKKMDDSKDIVENFGKCGRKVWEIIQEYFLSLDELNDIGCFQIVEDFAKDD